jgi:hypothetical protein
MKEIFKMFCIKKEPPHFTGVVAFAEMKYQSNEKLRSN